MNAVIVVVRFRQVALAHKEPVETFTPAQLKHFVHLDCFKWADLDTDLAAHTDRYVDVEVGWIKLRLAQVIGLLIFALNDVNALRRAFFFADLTGHTAQTRTRVVRVVNEKGKVARVFRERTAFLRILYRR